MIKSIIIDDEANCRVALKELLAKECPMVKVTAEFSSADEAYHYITTQQEPADLVFLDIQMNDLDGFDFLQKFERLPFHVIFTTAYDQYAIKAIRFSALDYLLKPVDSDELRKAVEKYTREKDYNRLNEWKLAMRNHSFFDKLGIPSLSEIMFVRIDDIICIQSDNNYSLVHTQKGEKLVSSKNIGYYEELLSDLHFFRVHNSYLINLKKIKQYVRGKSAIVMMDNGMRLDVASRRKEEFLEMLYLK